MTIIFFVILSFTPWLTIIPAYVKTNQCMCCNVISRAIRHASAATQNGVANLCLYQLQLMHVQMHVFSQYVVIR